MTTLEATINTAPKESTTTASKGLQ